MAHSFSLNFENTLKNSFHTVCCLCIHREELLPLLAVLANDLQYYNNFNLIAFVAKNARNRLYMDQCHLHIMFLIMKIRVTEN